MITPDQAGDLIERFRIHLHKGSGGWRASIGHFGWMMVTGKGRTWLDAIEGAVAIWVRREAAQQTARQVVK